MAQVQNASPQLAAPGAGLPGIELPIARVLFTLRAWTHGRRRIDALFRQERALIAELVRACPAGRLGERVLIPRPRGLEDSSRYWSVLMTLEHLRLVNLACAAIICELSEGRVPAGKASTADVKPSPDVTEAVISAYEASCDEVLAAVESAKDLDSAARFPHPWFGPMSARRWHVLAAVHLGLHRHQIEAILRGLKG
ncbi:MAG: DinB family protein [Verrucomicrobia bacterium]|jgi:DinB superfamily|nr:DinB family protein [Verrucomicrobiota bacterium]